MQFSAAKWQHTQADRQAHTPTHTHTRGTTTTTAISQNQHKQQNLPTNFLHSAFIETELQFLMYVCYSSPRCHCLRLARSQNPSNYAIHFWHNMPICMPNARLFDSIRFDSIQYDTKRAREIHSLCQ